MTHQKWGRRNGVYVLKGRGSTRNYKARIKERGGGGWESKTRRRKNDKRGGSTCEMDPWEGKSGNPGKVITYRQRNMVSKQKGKRTEENQMIKGN